MSKSSLLLASALALLAIPSLTQAQSQDCILSIRTQDVSVTPGAPFLNQSARVYATVQPLCRRDTEGNVLFYANDKLIGTKPISYKKSGLAEEVWTNWIASEYGDNHIRVDTKGESGEVGDSATITVFIDRDTDGDGIGNREDPDDDNDGVPDTKDQFPLDPAKTRDTDGDGIDDSIDSDDDNDGIYDFDEVTNGTNALMYDTDKDGVGDKQDAFPLDPKRSDAPPPEPIAAPTSVDSGAETQNPKPETSDGVVLGTEFAVTAVTSTIEDLNAASPAQEPNSSILDWILAMGWWWLLALALLGLAFFFFRQSRRKEEEES